MQRTVRTVRSLLITTIFIITFLLYAGLAVACYDPGEDTGNGSSNDSQRLTIYYDKLMVGSDATYPPFEYVEDGKVMGFDIDIATEIALIKSGLKYKDLTDEYQMGHTPDFETDYAVIECKNLIGAYRGRYRVDQHKYDWCPTS